MPPRLGVLTREDSRPAITSEGYSSVLISSCTARCISQTPHHHPACDGFQVPGIPTWHPAFILTGPRPPTAGSFCCTNDACLNNCIQHIPRAMHLRTVCTILVLVDHTFSTLPKAAEIARLMAAWWSVSLP